MGKLLWISLLVLLSIVVLGVCLWFTIGQSWVSRRIIVQTGPDGIKKFNEWKNDPILFPPDAVTPLAFSPQTRSHVSNLHKLWRNDPKLGSLLGEINSALMWGDKDKGILPLVIESGPKPLTSELERLDPFIRAFEALVNLNDYNIYALFEGEIRNDTLYYIPNYYGPWPESAATLALGALALADGGELESALQKVGSILRGSRVPPYSDWVAHIFSIPDFKIAVATWDYVVQSCGDIDLLRETFAEQKTWKSRRAPISTIPPLYVLNHVTSLRFSMARGQRVRIQGLTGMQLEREARRAVAQYIETVLLPRVSNNKRALADMRRRIDFVRYHTRYLREDFTRLEFPGPFDVDLSFPWLVGNKLSLALDYDFHTSRASAWDWPYERMDRNANTSLDLLKLRTAIRLSELESGKPPSTLAELVPNYFDEIPIDRYDPDGKPYKMGAVLYSVGPDKVDDGLQIIYDPTNGWNSGGDLLFSRDALKHEWNIDIGLTGSENPETEP